MSAFRFSLQQLLDLRSRSEDAARCQLAYSQREAGRHRARLEELQQACLLAGQDAAPAAGEPVQPAMLLNNDLHLARLRTLAAVQRTDVERSGRQEQQDRMDLVEKARHRQVLERLRDRRQEQHVAEQTRLERRQLDEAATMSFVHARNRTSHDAA